MSDYVPRGRSYPAHGDANSAEYRKTTHPRKRREGWGTRHFKTTQNLSAPKIFSHFKGWRTRPRRNGSVVLVVIGGWTRLWGGFNFRMLRAPDETALLVWRNFLAAFAVSPARPLH
jgi:hypothetical protein